MALLPHHPIPALPTPGPLWTPRRLVPGRQAPHPTPVCTEKRGDGVLSPRIESERERERERPILYILYIYIYIYVCVCVYIYIYIYIYISRGGREWAGGEPEGSRAGRQWLGPPPCPTGAAVVRVLRLPPTLPSHHAHLPSGADAHTHTWPFSSGPPWGRARVGVVPLPKSPCLGPCTLTQAGS